MPTLLADLTREVLRADEARGYTRVLWEPEHYADRPPLTEGRSMLTGFGGIDLATRTRYLRPEAWPVADTELSLAYLTVCRHLAAESASGGKMLRRAVPYRNPLPPPWPRIPGPPSYVYPCDTPLVRADIVACYARLYLGVTPDCFYRPEGPALLVGRIHWWRRDEWLELKGPRNRLWGLMCRKPRLLATRKLYNKPTTFAPHLTAFTMACLHSIALDAREHFGAVVWRANDEVWMPLENFEAFRAWLARTWRLELKDPEPVQRPVTGNMAKTYELPPSLREFCADRWRWADDAETRAGLPRRVRKKAGAGWWQPKRERGDGSQAERDTLASA